MKDNTKPKRLRKTAEAIKVAGNTKTPPMVQKCLLGSENTLKRDNKMFDGIDISNSYQDEVGKWR